MCSPLATVKQWVETDVRVRESLRLIRTVLKKTVTVAVKDGMNPADCEPEGPEGCVEKCGVHWSTPSRCWGGMSFRTGPLKQRISSD